MTLAIRLWFRLSAKSEKQLRNYGCQRRMKELRDNASSLAALKERAALTEQQLRVAEEERKECMREVQQMREQQAANHERRELLREVQALRERLAAIEGRKAEKTDKPAGVRNE